MGEARVNERMKTVEGMTEIETVHVPWSSRMNGDGTGASRDEMGRVLSVGVRDGPSMVQTRRGRSREVDVDMIDMESRRRRG